MFNATARLYDQPQVDGRAYRAGWHRHTRRRAARAACWLRLPGRRRRSLLRQPRRPAKAISWVVVWPLYHLQCWPVAPNIFGGQLWQV